NDVTEQMLTEHILPHAEAVPIIAGLLASDPTVSVTDRLERWRSWQVHGVINYPSVTLLDGTARAIFEDQGATVAAELTLLEQARARGLVALGFVGLDLVAAPRFAGAGLDALVLTVGMTREFEDIHERRDWLQHAIRQLGALLESVRQVNPNLPCLV